MANPIEPERAEWVRWQGDQSFRFLVDRVKDYAIFMLDPTGHVATWNAGAESIKGYKAEEIIGQHFSRFYPPEKVAEGWPDHELAEASVQGRFEDEGWRVRKDGSRFWANVIITALRDEAGVLRGFAKVTRDMTDRRQTEEVLRQSEERFRLLIENVKDYALIMLDPNGLITSWNPGAARTMGYQAEEILGQHFSRFYTPEDVEAGKPTEELRVAAEEGRCEDEGWRVRKDGSRFWADTIITVLRDDNGRLRGFAKVTRDVTQRKEAEEQLKQFAARLQRSNRELEEFASVASHDLQEPLRKIQAFGDRLQTRCGEALGEQGRDYLARILDAAGRMRTLIDDLLTFSRIRTRAQPFVPVDLARVAREVVSDLEGRLQQTGGRVEVGDLPTVAADPTQMRQLLQNLIANALKFRKTDEPPVVKVQAQVLPVPGGEGVCRLSVEDNGIGFDEKYLDRIFNVFQRLHGRSQYEGTGMGLAICRKIVERHNGQITAQSTPGHGSTFLITLPVRQPRGDGSRE